jgi:signal peptidase I
METSGLNAPAAPPSWLRRLVIGRNPRVTLLRALALVVVSFITFKFILLPIRVTGGSMEPNFRDRRVNFINRLAYLQHAPQRGDVVGVRFTGPSVMLLKRVVGLPGEQIGFAQGRVTVNGAPLAEPYLVLRSDWNRAPITLGPDEFFVVGDNRSMPMQWHYFGIAERRRILGKALL